MRLSSYEPYLLSILRIVVGFMFMPHGFQKLFGAFGGRTVAAFPTQMWVAGALETFGGLLILLGLFTRPVAFVLAGMMAVAYFQAHYPQDFWPLLNRGELAALYCFVYLYLCVAGPGPLSLDATVRKVKR